MRKLLYGLIGLVVVAVVAALIVPGFIDWNSRKAEIAAQVKQATGRDLRINGDLDLSVLPSPSLSADDVRLANIAGATAPEMIRLKSLRVRIRFMPLLSGRIEVESVDLIEPVIELEKLADGRASWEFGEAEPAGGKPSQTTSPDDKESAARAGSRNQGANDFRLDSLHIVGGTLIYRDAQQGSVERIENLDAELSAESLAGPFAMEGTLRARAIPLKINATVGRVSERTPTAFKLTLALPDAGTEAEISGALIDIATNPRLTGKLTAKGPSLAALIAAVSGSSGPAVLKQPYSLDGRIDGTAKSIAVDGIALRLGDTNANGGINAVIGEKIQADIALRIGRIDLDKLLASSGGNPTAAAGGGTAPPARSTRPAADTGFTLPAGINGSLDLAVDAATLYGGQIRNVKLAASLNEGELTLNQASARLPGGGEASLFGFLTAPGGIPAFDGSVDLRADNLRGVLQWLKFDAATVPADRLRKFAFAAKIKANPNQVQIASISMQLDASRIKGGVTYALGRARPAFGARFNIDQLNLDAYAPPDGGRGGKQDGAATGDAASRTENARPGTAPAPLKALNAVDANLNLRIGTLNYRRTPIQGVRLEGTLQRGKLTLKEARIRSLAGTSASIKGTVTGLSGLPIFKGDFAVNSRDITGLVRVAGIKTPVPAKQYGRLKFSGRADADADGVKLVSKLQIAGARATLDGAVTNLRKSPRFDLKLSATHPELARLAPLLGVELGAGTKSLGIVGLSGLFKGDLTAVDVDTRIKAAGADARFTGRVSNPVMAPNLDGAFELSHRSYAGLMRMLDPSFRPTRQNLGALRLTTRVTGTEKEFKLESLKGDIGPTRISGEGRLSLDGERPRLVASLASGEVDLNALMSAPEGGKASPAPAGPGAIVAAPAARGGRYSRKPMDVSALDALDADIRLAARAIIWRNFRVDGPQLTATIKDRVLTVSKLAGRMFDGGFDLTGRLNGAGVPALDGKVKIDRANVGKALFQTGTFDIEGGIMNYDMTLTGQGRSEYDMISSLNGDGRLSVRDGVAKGFDLRAVSDRLKNLGRASDILGLFGTAMGGGATKFSTLDGTFQIRKGVLQTKDMKLVADAGDGDMSGFVDMPRWNMDVVAQFRLTEHPKAPPFGMRVTGAPDNPRRLFKYEKLQAFLFQRGVGSLLNKVLKVPQPQQQQPTTQDPQQQPQPQKVQPQDLLRGLLQGLQRR